MVAVTHPSAYRAAPRRFRHTRYSPARPCQGTVSLYASGMALSVRAPPSAETLGHRGYCANTVDFAIEQIAVPRYTAASGAMLNNVFTWPCADAILMANGFAKHSYPRRQNPLALSAGENFADKFCVGRHRQIKRRLQGPALHPSVRFRSLTDR